MTDKDIIQDMNTAEIIEPLRIHFISYEKHQSMGISVKEILDIINRLQAELNKYQHIENTVNSFWSGLQQLSILKGKDTPTLEELLEYIEQVKAEAYTELDDLKRDTIPKLKHSLERANKYGIETDKENEKLKTELKSLKALKAYLDNLCDLDIEILGIDQQGDSVSFDTFYNQLLEEIESGSC